MNNRIDQLSMLLSTDWFSDKWALLGIQSDRLRCQNMQRECRQIVADLFGGEQDYWLVSFESDRIKSTCEKFFSAAKESSLEAQDIKRFKCILEDSESQMSETSLLENLTHLLISNPDAETLRGLPLALVEKLIAIWAKLEVPLDLKSALNASTTEWDIDIQKRTPGLPEYLGDFAVGLCSRLSFIEQFWAQVMKEVLEEEKNELLTWYRQMAQELAGRQISFG